MEGQVSQTQSLQEGDLVLGRTFGYDKLKPDWEGPFTVVDDESKGTKLCNHYEPKLLQLFRCQIEN